MKKQNNKINRVENYCQIISKSRILLMILLSTFIGCKKFVDVPAPYTSLSSDNVFLTDATSISAITSMYTKYGSADGSMGGYGFASITECAGAVSR